MAMTPRYLAPVADPEPPKPPQLNLVASSAMPDVATDTFGPGAGPPLTASAMADAGWANVYAKGARDGAGDMVWNRPAGDVMYRIMAERRNALIASVGVMSDLELKQAEIDYNVTPESLPTSVFPATAKSRWTGGFAYAPENQYPGGLVDGFCNQPIDLPFLATGSLAVPTSASATPSNTGGTLTHAHGPYTYVVVGVDITGGQGLPTAPFTATIATGSAGSAAVAWSAPATGGTPVAYNVYRDGVLIANVTGTSFTDTGAKSPTLAGQFSNLPQVGYIPFVIVVEDTASAFGWEVRDFTGRALRLLDNATPNALEREFYTGSFARNTITGPIYQADFPSGLNAFLTQPGIPVDGGSSIAAVDLTPSGGPCSITRGIQIGEDYLANTGFGGQGMIHVAPETSPNLLGARRVGALLLSVMDNIIVPGSGYPTSGATGPIGNADATPADGVAWIYFTDLTSVRLDEPVVWPQDMAEAVHRSDNTIRFRAERYGAVTFDGARLAAVQVNLPS